MSEVNHPRHYNACGPLEEDGTARYEAIKVIEDWGLGFCLGSALKYICRAPHKGFESQDLDKAYWYIDRACKHSEFVKVHYNRTMTCDDVCNAWGLSGPLVMVVLCLYQGKLGSARVELYKYIAEEL